MTTLRNCYVWSAPLAVCLVGCGPADGSAAARLSATNTAELLAGLKSAKPGSTIQLAAGTYSGVAIQGERFSAPVNIEGAPGEAKSVFTDLTIKDSRGLVLRRIDFDASHTAVGTWGAESTIAFSVGSSQDIQFDGDAFHGDANGTLANTVSGLIVRDSDAVSITNSDFTHLHNAFQHVDDTHLTLRGNSFHELWDDAMRGGGSSWVTIDANHCWSNHPDITDPDHPDCIQFWTSGTKTSAHDIVITNNRYELGRGTPTQFIFVGNELGIPYENVTISGNVGYGAGWNGIAIGDANNVTITGNTLVSSCKVWAEPNSRPQAMTSRMVVSKVNGLALENNAVGDFTTRGGNVSVKIKGEKTTSCKDKTPD